MGFSNDYAMQNPSLTTNLSTRCQDLSAFSYSSTNKLPASSPSSRAKSPPSNEASRYTYIGEVIVHLPS